MITQISEDVFPYNVLKVVAEHLPKVDDPEPVPAPNQYDWAPISIFKRPLRPNDPPQSLGIFPDNWQPDEDSYELMGMQAGNGEPTLQRFFFGIHVIVKNANEEMGQNIHAVLADRVRHLLYTDAALDLALTGLNAQPSQGTTQSLKRWKVTDQKYLSNEQQGLWYYLATIRFYVEVETRHGQ